MTDRYSSQNEASTSGAENAASNPLLIAHGNKSVELKVMKDAMSMYRISFAEREKILEEEKRKLEELSYQVWSLEDSFCDQVWSFSKEHDFSAVFEQYPFVAGIGRAKQANYDDDVERCSELINLINEIDVINTEIFNFNCGKNVKREVELALTNLGKLQAISDDITELLSLLRPSKFSCKPISMPIYDEAIPSSENKIKRRKNDSDREDLRTKKIRDNHNESSENKLRLKNDKSNFMPDKKVIATPNNYPQLFVERSIVFTAETDASRIMDVPAKLVNSETEKHKNFTLKKRSEISIKFEKDREHK